MQLLHMQIPKAQKDSQVKQRFSLLGAELVKAAGKHIDEIDPLSIFSQCRHFIGYNFPATVQRALIREPK